MTSGEQCQIQLVRRYQEDSTMAGFIFNGDTLEHTGGSLQVRVVNGP
jgi:hypothetical protein